jgi:hypothetical protein
MFAMDRPRPAVCQRWHSVLHARSDKILASMTKEEKDSILESVELDEVSEMPSQDKKRWTPEEDRKYFCNSNPCHSRFFFSCAMSLSVTKKSRHMNKKSRFLCPQRRSRKQSRSSAPPIGEKSREECQRSVQAFSAGDATRTK